MPLDIKLKGALFFMILKMKLLNGKYGVCRFESGESIPPWSYGEGFVSVTQTEDELSIVCRMDRIPNGIVCEENWRILKVLGPLDFSLVGILSNISKVLADEDISIFAISTYDTDYILIKDSNLEDSIQALEIGGYEIHR